MLKELNGGDRAVEVDKPGLRGEMERLKGREAAIGTGTVGDFQVDLRGNDIDGISGVQDLC
jgi:hypothetical protein